MGIILKTGLQQFTPNTLVDMPTLLRDLEQAREQGYTVDKEEHVIGLNCIASERFMTMLEAWLRLSPSQARPRD